MPSPQRVIGVGVWDAELPASVLETVQGVVVGYNDEGELIGHVNLTELSQERRDMLGHRLLQMGADLLEGKLQIH